MLQMLIRIFKPGNILLVMAGEAQVQVFMSTSWAPVWLHFIQDIQWYEMMEIYVIDDKLCEQVKRML